MRILYDIFFIIFSIISFPFILVKGKVHSDFLQRFGFLSSEITSLEKPVWIHAVSVGEGALAVKLAGAIKQRSPKTPIIVSTTTQTGSSMVRKLAAGNVDAIFYYPVDISFVVWRIVKLLSPQLYIMIETELWPNLLEEFRSKSIPAILVNGRISDSSFGNYKKIKFITRRILRCIDWFCVQSERDAERIKELGASSDKISVTGNIKFDEKINLNDSSDFNKEHLGFNANDEVIIAGSTHFPEEPAIIDVYKELLSEHSDLKLILAPRHVERSDAIKVYIEKTGLKYCQLSNVIKNGGVLPERCNILLVDTIGHLKDLYSLATVVFIGGSLVKKGGQNPIEAARWGKPVIFGPHMFNFRETSNIFLEKKAAICVKDALELKDALNGLLKDSLKKEEMSKNARGVIEANSGTLQRTMEIVGKYVV